MENQRLEYLLENELFRRGLSTGINISLQMILAAHERDEPLIIDDKPYYILTGQELLKQMLDEVCQ